MRWISGGDDLHRWRWTLDRRVTPRLSLGLEQTGRAFGQGVVTPRGTWFITPEGKNHPSVTLGFTADRLSTPRGTAIFVTSGHSIPGTPVSVFASLKYSTDMQRVGFPFGANVRIGQDMTFQAIYDGDYTHMLLSKGWQGNITTSLVMARSKWPGLQLSVGF